MTIILKIKKDFRKLISWLVASLAREKKKKRRVCNGLWEQKLNSKLSYKQNKNIRPQNRGNLNISLITRY